ncbi:37S ribosomal protein, mitochondrial [Wickerhamomyces ciferrii]|uniref:37S ribosomal protein, mitochondrial n=1 Tax=Wickerhamomyces ciferrii (strain ATCC 14091 / BCRC 22168 / CBS 111 / JCM 3599 / NBRC 0793 / NRRL Y-1031 F-60-10) TaxID=1206466 RepID=K0KF05_WICCF|nr:37S ribosomal protein, mitochondrial [Wickerhamomyces ciferrii]CCH43720.1 37S ribosomal protein, mitochondrial [Wickerhamomyces ciferrii]
MVKGPAKYGGKSGTLPVVRQIFKKPIKPVERIPDKNSGYAPNVKEPRNSSREQKLPEFMTIKDRINKTVQLPKNQPTNINARTPEQKLKQEKAQLRRQYFIHSMNTEENRLKQEKLDEEKRIAFEKAQEEKYMVKPSPLAELTLPTLSSYLDGPLMRQRTKEETRLLKTKRNANRLNLEFETKLNRSSDLLQLYYSAENFITKESDLLKAVEEAFAPGNEVIPASNPEYIGNHYAEDVGDALFGTIDNHPGLGHVEGQLNGDNKKFKQEVAARANELLNQHKEVDA